MNRHRFDYCFPIFHMICPVSCGLLYQFCPRGIWRNTSDISYCKSNGSTYLFGLHLILEGKYVLEVFFLLYIFFIHNCHLFENQSI